MQKVTKFEFEIMYDDSETTEEEALNQFRNILIERELLRDDGRQVIVNYWPIFSDDKY